jgi:deoxyadenosine/deoxycytidine kinase
MIDYKEVKGFEEWLVCEKDFSLDRLLLSNPPKKIFDDLRWSEEPETAKLALLQEYLREENIIVSVDFRRVRREIVYDWFVFNNNSLSERSSSEELTDKYNEALEEGLKEAIKLIKE